jgi:hypothetical protein
LLATTGKPNEERKERKEIKKNIKGRKKYNKNG